MPEFPSATPWSDLDEHGTGLTVDAFITTLMSQVGNALRRTITVPYAEEFGLTVSEWRLLSLVAHSQRIAFADLVTQSTSDKALVSRTLKLLEGRELVRLEAEGAGPRKKMWCVVTPQGDALHREAIPIARARQAAAIRVLPPEERDAMYRALVRLRQHCLQGNPDPREAPGDLRGLDI
ncbi:MarR family winged helix-turn-helix transcriptional regulator [Xenophilus arseniciresistens]|uniref:MarR family winged helix-turn-helix transcriptional regulator n=1 Tax=Xenophilus arseniciresistens TaxID=1283306 RepID=A0AAE3SXI1_9BURK|nr:MarR family winged helix-turn-helix transcriptional regulator [Xenophilus arseniciresistens]MDA7414964.1 MarR family winged helix-turn-helix transcriptional regulator [Xenophilus arseniciresistens]